VAEIRICSSDNFIDIPLLNKGFPELRQDCCMWNREGMRIYDMSVVLAKVGYLLEQFLSVFTFLLSIAFSSSALSQ
jgi:hypothetical protein